MPTYKSFHEGLCHNPGFLVGKGIGLRPLSEVVHNYEDISDTLASGGQWSQSVHGHSLKGAMDILGPLPPTRQGNRYILVIMDDFTKWPEAYALPNQEAGVVARVFVEGLVCRHGIPEELHTDQGGNFESELLKEVCSLL